MRMIFINLPVKDLEAAKRFYGALGFTPNPQFSDEKAACMVVEENISVMLLSEAYFRTFIEGEISDTSRGVEVLNCISADSREQVDATVRAALATGGKPWKPAIDHGWMYNCSFRDPDGHVWEVAWMDPAAAQQGVQDTVGEPA